MRRLSRAAALCFLAGIVACPSSLRAQAPDARQLSCSASVEVSIFHEEGRPLADLRPEQLRPSMGGRKLSVAALTRPQQLPRVVLALDSSASMMDGRWPLARRIADDALVLLAARRYPVALLVFASATAIRLGFDQPLEQKMRALATLPWQVRETPRGARRTALWDALHEGLALLEPARPGDVMFLITDGHDNASRTSQAQILRALTDRQVRPSAVMLRDPITAHRYPQDGIQGFGASLGSVIYESGGWLLESRTLLGIDRREGKRALERREVDVAKFAVRTLISGLQGTYELTLQSSVPWDKSRSWKLSVTTPDGKKAKDLVVFYPRKLGPCTVRKLADVLQ